MADREGRYGEDCMEVNVRQESLAEEGVRSRCRVAVIKGQTFVEECGPSFRVICNAGRERK